MSNIDLAQLDNWMTEAIRLFGSAMKEMHWPALEGHLKEMQKTGNDILARRSLTSGSPAKSEISPLRPAVRAIQAIECPYNEKDHGANWHVSAHAWDMAMIAAIRAVNKLIDSAPVHDAAAPSAAQAVAEAWEVLANEGVFPGSDGMNLAKGIQAALIISGKESKNTVFYSAKEDEGICRALGNYHNVQVCDTTVSQHEEARTKLFDAIDEWAGAAAKTDHAYISVGADDKLKALMEAWRAANTMQGASAAWRAIIVHIDARAQSASAAGAGSDQARYECKCGHSLNVCLATSCEPAELALAPSVTVQDERALFETWLYKDAPSGTYVMSGWDAWQARAALAHPVQDGEKDAK